MRRICGYCGNPMRGFASVNGVWHCHPDEGQDCYQLAQWQDLDQRPVAGIALLLNGPISEEGA